MNFGMRSVALVLAALGALSVGCGDDGGAAEDSDPIEEGGAGGAGAGDASGGAGAEQQTGGMGGVGGMGAGGEEVGGAGGGEPELPPTYATNDGQDLGVEHALHLSYTQGGARYDIGMLSDASNQCVALQNDVTVANSTHVFVSLIRAWDNNQAAPPLEVGTYELGESLDANSGVTTYAGVVFEVTDDGCDDVVDEDAESGTITITGASATGMVGEFEVTFASGNVVVGAFDTTPCTGNVTLTGNTCLDSSQIVF